MKKLLIAITSLFVAMVFTACSGIASNTGLASIEGTMLYRERIALPENAKVTVTLADVSKMDVPAEVISSQSFMTGGQQVPIVFKLNYDPTEIKVGHTYGVSARIEIDGRLIFISNEANWVITDPNNTLNPQIMLVRASQ